jgi:glycine/D-amino acid oxidase-like deaminating enzyme
MRFADSTGRGAVWADRALAEAQPCVYWLDDPARPPARDSVVGDTDTDLVIVGGGFTGLWAALEAKRRDPDRDVLLVEAGRVGDGGSGRNGGFCSASLTHGLANGVARFGPDIGGIVRLGHDNFDGLCDDVGALGIDCDLRRVGEIDVATRPHELARVHEQHDLMVRYGQAAEHLDAGQVRARLDSPTYLGGVFDPDGTATLHPARLAWGLLKAAVNLGVRVHEHTPVRELCTDGAGVRARTPFGAVCAERVLLAGSGWPPLLSAIRRYVVPVYDYVLVTEPLMDRHWAAIGWSGREGFADVSNQLHYYRVTPDGRILWGGYDAIYHFGNRTGPTLEQRWATYRTLSKHFFATFPQLEGLRFTHRWGGVIDTCSRFSVMFGTGLKGRAAYAVGYTGLGVAATRFGAHAALDLLQQPPGPLVYTPLVARRPLPFPPEPLRWLSIEATKRALAHEDSTGRHGSWLSLLDRVGLGFTS